MSDETPIEKKLRVLFETYVKPAAEAMRKKTEEDLTKLYSAHADEMETCDRCDGTCHDNDMHRCGNCLGTGLVHINRNPCATCYQRDCECPNE